MKKKLINIVPALFCIGIIIAGCTKLDKNIYNQVPEDEFFKTPQQVTAAIAPAYNPLTNIPAGSVFTLNEVASDELIAPTRGNDWYDGGKWQALWNHAFKADIDDVDLSWGDISRGITKCNFTLNLLNTLKEKPANVDQINAEIKVLRAFYLFLFMDLYGNVPLVTDFQTDPSTVVTVPRKEVFAFIESELNTNVPLLEDKTSSNYGHFNKWGGYMLLGKLYLNAQVYTGTPQWAKAEAALDMVVKSGKYALQPNFLDNFIVNNEGSVENIFVVPFDNINIHGNSIELNTLNYNSISTYNLTGQPYNGFCAPTAFYRSFTDNDLRKKMWLTGQQFSSTGEVLIDPATSLNVIISPYVLQFSNPADSFKFAGARSVKYAPQPGTYGDTSNDGVIFRLADAYLMKAEAQLRAGTVTDALTLVNEVRTRAGVPAWTSRDFTLPNLLQERGREFAWEGWRRNDLIRFEVADGIKYFTGARVPGKPQDPDTHTFIYPIPAPQLISNPKLVQNPGY
ncbi:MAG: RagB/SusD family nutrient uptake outer membrane protein [Pedobacter sp.]|jgi:hypothetical protein|nr:RagB/SusD family nutrient uptake outer membrane protein [Pedobacter sp.]